MKLDFDNWYKSKFSEFNSEPPSTVWEDISETLDLDDTWNGINRNLNKRDNRKRALVISFATFAIALIGTGAFFIGKQLVVNKSPKAHIAKNVANKKTVYNNKNNTEVKKDNLSVNPEHIDITKKEGPIQLVSTQKQSLKKNHQVVVESKLYDKKIADSSLESTNEDVALSNTVQEIKNNRLVNLMNLLNTLLSDVIIKNSSSDSLIQNVKLLSNKQNKESPFQKYLTVGINATSLNSWLLNGDTYNGLSKNTLNQTVLSFGNSYGVNCNYDLSNKYSAQAEWIVNNKQNQNYVDYVEGLQTKRDVKMNFTQFNFLIKKKNPRLILGGRVPASLNYIAGLQYGYLKTCTQTIDGQTSSIKRDYKTNNYSLALGIEYQIFIKQLWVISTGLRANVGLRNIYSGKESNIPSNLNNTYNSSVGLSIGVGYRLPLR